MTAARPDPITIQRSARPEPSARPSVVASADVGSNSVHLLVAVVAGHRLTPLIDESVFLGLGSRVSGHGYLGAAARAELTATLVRYADSARRLGASTVTFLGTQPIRSASDAGAIVQEAVAASGAPLHVLSHEEEALLTLIGVTEGRPVTDETLVIDIGGGSSEFCLLAPVGPPLAAGVQLGSASLTDTHVVHDPPTASEVAAMRAAAQIAIQAAPEAHPADVVAVGGTASNLVKVLPAAMLDRTLTRERIAEAQSILASEPAAVAAERHLINPIRARILPAGGAILDAILERYGSDRIRVSEAGIREGAVLVVAHAGPAWRDRLSELAHGWQADEIDETDRGRPAIS